MIDAFLGSSYEEQGVGRGGGDKIRKLKFRGKTGFNKINVENFNSLVYCVLELFVTTLAKHNFNKK